MNNNEYLVGASITFLLDAPTKNSAKNIAYELLQNCNFLTSNKNIKLGFDIRCIEDIKKITTGEYIDEDKNNNSSIEYENKKEND